MMRYSYVIPRLVLVGLAWALLAFAVDPVLRRVLVYAGQRAAGARVEIGEVDTALPRPRLALRNVQVADRANPMRNLIELDEAKFELETGPLLKRKYVVSEASVTGIRWMTARSTSGALALDRRERDGGPLDAWRDELGRVGKDWMADLLDPGRLEDELDELESARLARTLHQEWLARFERLQARADRLQARIRELEQLREPARDDPIDALRTYGEVPKKARELAAELQAVRAEWNALVQAARDDRQRIAEAKQRDLRRLQDRLPGRQFDADRIAEMLFGPRVSDALAQTLRWLRWSRQHVDNARQKSATRQRGLDIAFARKSNVPDVLVRRLTLQGEAEIGGRAVPFIGVARGITPHPAVYGEPTVIQIESEPNEGGRLSVEVTLDHTGTVPKESIVLACSGVLDGTVRLGDPETFAVDVAAKNLELAAQLAVQQEQVVGNVRLLQQPAAVAPAFAEQSARLAEVLGPMVQGIREVRADIGISGTLDRPSIEIRTNLGSQLAAGLNQWAAEQLAQQREKLQRGVDEALAHETSGFREQLGDRPEQLVSGLQLGESQIANLQKRLMGRFFR